MAKKKPPVIKTNVALEALTIEYLPVESIQPNEYNPNRMSEKDFELLLRSMREDGFTQPIIVHRTTRKIVDGEHRWRAGSHLGMKEVPVVLVDMTPEQMRIATLRHNRARGSEDIQLSADVLRDLEKLGALAWAADSLMLTDAEVEKLLEDVPAPEALAGDSYNDAWAPKPRMEANPEEAQLHGVTAGSQAGIENTTALSVQALERQRERERKLQAAHTEEERELVRKDGTLYRINLIFADGEAELVKRVLGERPAQRLLEMCQREMAAA